MAEEFVVNFDNALRNGTITLDIVQAYVQGKGCRLDGRDHRNNVGLFDESMTQGTANAIKAEGKRSTGIAVGGNLPLINWVVEQAIDYAGLAKVAASLARAQDFKKKAITLLALADYELEKIFPNSRDNLSDQWDIVNAPLPVVRYPLDN